MDANILNPYELDALLIAQFGLDCDLIDENCEFDNLLDDYLSTSRSYTQRMLLENLTEIDEQSDEYDVLKARYCGEFAPERWELSAEEWVKIVKNRTKEFLHKGEHSSEISGD